MEALLHAPLAVFIAQAAVIIVLSRVIGLFARRAGQPMVVAEILAGVLLGPSLLGWIAPRVSSALFPASSMALLGMTSQVGLVLFMFLIGLELDPKHLGGRARTSVAISYSSIVAPFGLGAILALRVRAQLMPAGVSSTAFVLFVGAAMSITAFPVLARILVERRLLRSRVGAITIACAAVDDVTGWCVLAFVVSVARASSIAAAIGTVVAALFYIAFMLFVVRPLLGRVAERTKVGLSQNLVAVILVGVLMSSFATETIGIHALFGAFLFGAVFPKQGSLASALAEKIEDVVVVLLLPLFFAYSGLRTQIGLLDSPSAWGTCGAIILVAVAGKFGGSFVAGKLTSLSWREAGAVGILMNTRGLMELIILNIGLDLGVISPMLFTMMVVMALVTTFMTTPLLQLVYPIAELSKELVETPLSEPMVGERYTALVCVSRESSAAGLLRLGAAACGRDPAHARLYALRLLKPANRASFVLDQHKQEDADARRRDAILEPLAEKARDLDVKLRPLSFVSSAPARDICEVAEVKGADIVVLGWHKPIVGDAMLTGVVHDVMVDAASDVGVLVDRGLDKIERLLVPFLGTEHDRAALRLARRVAENTGAEVVVLHVVAPDGESAGAQTVVREELEDGGEGKRFRVVFKAVAHKVPIDAAIEESRAGYDMLIVGAGRQWGLEHKTFGRRAEAILASAPCSVVVVRRGGRKAVAAEVSASAHRDRFATVV